MSTDIKIVLPKPPSVNHLYAYTARGGYIHGYMTAQGKVWFEEAIYKAKSQAQFSFLQTKIKVTIYFFTSRETSDLDNINKGLLDVLQKSEIIDNDKYVYELHSYKKICKKEEERVELILSSLQS